MVRSLAELADSLPAVAHAMASLGTDCAGGVLHVAVCGSDAMKLSPSAEQLLAGGALGAAEPDAKVFSSAELIGHDGPQEKTRRVAAAVADAKAALRRLQVWPLGSCRSLPAAPAPRSLLAALFANDRLFSPAAECMAPAAAGLLPPPCLPPPSNKPFLTLPRRLRASVCWPPA